MCGNCKDGKCGGGCTFSLIAKILLIIGGLNWGLVGASMVLDSATSWNLVSMLLGSMPIVEGIVYLVVGLAAVMSIFGCKCKKCATCEVSTPAMGGEQKM